MRKNTSRGSSYPEERGWLSRQLFDPAVTGHADVDRLLRTEPQVQLTNPPVLNNHSNDFKSHCTFPFTACGALSEVKRIFYEQVTGVKVCSSFFSFIGFLLLLLFLVFVVPHVALHRVSIRTLDELSWCKLGAGWGSRGESMLPFLVRPLRPKRARSHRNTVSSQRVNMIIS